MSRMFSEVFNMSLTGTAVILFVLAARLVLKKAPKIYSYALWSVVLFRLLCPVSIPSPVSLLELTRPEVTQSEGITSSVSYLPAEYVAADEQVHITPIPQTAGIRQETARSPVSVRTAAPYIWVAGIVLMLLYSMATYARLRYQLVGAVPYRGEIYLADHIPSPFVLGILRPKIYLPSDTPMKERRFIVAHERCHIRRHDHIIKLLAYGALCLHWFNPFVWLAFVLAGKDMEMSCDEAVIQKLGDHIRADYSASLLRLATHRKIIAGTPLAFGEGDTKGRVRNMAKWKKPKLWVSILCLILCVAILAACAVNPEKEPEIAEGEKTAGDIAFEKCLAVMETVENGSYYIAGVQKNDGKEGPSGYSRIYCQNDEDWLNISTVLTEGENTTEAGDYYSRHAYLCVNNISFSNKGHQGESGDIVWIEDAAADPDTPWLGHHTWDRSFVTYMDTQTDENGECLRFRYNKMYEDREGYADHYFVNFYFDPSGNFRNVEIQVNPDRDNAFTVTESIVSLDPDTVAAEIECYFLYGRETQKETSVAADKIIAGAGTLQYGNLTMTLPDDYTCREENGKVILTRDGTDVGGITCWTAPDFPLSMAYPNYNWTEWLQAMGLPEAQESDEPIGCMMGNSLYGDLEAEFFNELHPEKLNVEHHFFIDGKLVYDVYYDQNVLSDAWAERFLKTIQLYGKYVQEPNPSEEDSLAKVRSLLESVQSGSYFIRTERKFEGDLFLNDSASIDYLRSGEDFLTIQTIPEGGDNGTTVNKKSGYLYKDGTYFDNELVDGIAGAMDENGNVRWTQSTRTEVYIPWLAGFQWNEKTVSYTDTLPDNGGECVMLRIDEPFPGLEEETECYFINVYFDANGSFREVAVDVDFIHDNEVQCIDETISIVTLDPETVAAEIEKEYLRANG